MDPENCGIKSIKEENIHIILLKYWIIQNYYSHDIYIYKLIIIDI